MECTTRFCVSRGRCMIITLPRELDHYAAEQVRSEAECIFMKSPIQYVVFDFSHTVFMDSSGIGLITGRYRKICDIGGIVYVTGLSAAMDKLFLMSGLDTIVTKINSIEEAYHEE